MQFVKEKWTHLVKAYKHYSNPNDNPTEHDRRVFQLLSKGQVDMFIDYMENNPVNLHVREFTSANLLILAQDVANDTNNYKKAISQEERTARAIKATLYLLQKGIDINYRNKNGGTALQASVHWQNYQVAAVLLKRGADPNIGCENPLKNLPIVSALLKNNMDMILLLISYGADVEAGLALAGQEGIRRFPISEEQRKTLLWASNLQSVIRRRRYEIALQKKTVLSLLSEAQFEELCFYL